MKETPAPTAANPSKRLAGSITAGGLLTIAILIAMPFVFGEPDLEKRPDIVRFIGRFHPVFLHLPIGIFALVLVQEIYQFIRKSSRPLGLLSMFFAAGSAVFATLLGFILYQGGNFNGSETVIDHLWGGIIFTCVAILALIAKSWSLGAGSSQFAFRALLLSSIAIMGYASHDGASVTHGKNYLTRYAPAPIKSLLGIEKKEEKPEEVEIPLEEQVVFDNLVMPIFEMRCIECHKESAAKGKLRMDTFEMLLKGGKEGDAIEPGNAIDSNIIFRCELPEDDEEHMPPEGKSDILDHELAIVKWWIDQGASPTVKVGELELGEEIQGAIATLLSLPMTGVPDTAKILEEAVTKLRMEFPKSLSIAEDDPQKLVFSGLELGPALTDEKFEELAEVIPYFVSVELTATSISQKAISLLADAENLKELRLAETKVDDSWVNGITKLKSLERINLSGTNITAQGLSKIAKLADLKAIYLWETNIPVEDLNELRKAHPEVRFLSGK